MKQTRDARIAEALKSLTVENAAALRARSADGKLYYNTRTLTFYVTNYENPALVIPVRIVTDGVAEIYGCARALSRNFSILPGTPETKKGPSGEVAKKALADLAASLSTPEAVAALERCCERAVDHIDEPEAGTPPEDILEENDPRMIAIDKLDRVREHLLQNLELTAEDVSLLADVISDTMPVDAVRMPKTSVRIALTNFPVAESDEQHTFEFNLRAQFVDVDGRGAHLSVHRGYARVSLFVSKVAKHINAKFRRMTRSTRGTTGSFDVDGGTTKKTHLRAGEFISLYSDVD